jgi:hypothetical protein
MAVSCTPSWLHVHHAGFEVGDPPVGEAIVLAGGGQPVGESPQLGFLVAGGAFECEVLAGHADPVLFGPAGVQVADLADEFGDLLALAQDLGMRGLERVLAVQRPFASGGLQCLVFGCVAFGSSPGGLWADAELMICRASGLS